MLYIGDVKFVDDDRFELLPGNGYSDWTLRFRLIREADAGNYECQISTSPKLSQTFTLNVVGKYSLDLYHIIRGGASSKLALSPSGHPPVSPPPRPLQPLKPSRIEDCLEFEAHSGRSACNAPAHCYINIFAEVIRLYQIC